jgi:hypothetical protein
MWSQQQKTPRARAGGAFAWHHVPSEMVTCGRLKFVWVYLTLTGSVDVAVDLVVNN